MEDVEEEPQHEDGAHAGAGEGCQGFVVDGVEGWWGGWARVEVVVHVVGREEVGCDGGGLGDDAVGWGGGEEERGFSWEREQSESSVE